MQRQIVGKPQPLSPRRHSRTGLLPNNYRPARVSLANTSRPKRPSESAANYCQVHTRLIELFCLTCSEYLCPDCTVFSNHYQHKIVTSREAEGRSSLRNDQVANELIALRTELAKRAGLFRNDAQTERVRLTGEVNSFFSEIVRKLESRKTEAAKQIAEFFEFANDNFQKKREELETLVEALSVRARQATAELRPKLAEQTDKLRKRVMALTCDGFVRQKLQFVVNKDWRDTLEGMALLETVRNPEFNMVWDTAEDTWAVEVATPEPQSPYLQPQKQPPSNSNSQSIDPAKAHDMTIYRSVGKDPVSISTWCDMSANLYQSEKQPTKPDDQKTPRVGSIDKNLVISEAEELLYTRKSLFHRTMAANPVSSRRESDATSMRPALNRSALHPLEGLHLSPGRNGTQRGNSMAAMSRSLHPQMSAGKLIKSFGEFLPNLDFSRKSMTVDEMIKMFGDTVITGPVKTLNLSQNALTDLGLKKILKNLVTLAFAELDLSGNKLSKHALDYLLSFLTYNSGLKVVHLRDNLRLRDDEEDVRRRVELLEQKGVRVSL